MSPFNNEFRIHMWLCWAQASPPPPSGAFLDRNGGFCDPAWTLAWSCASDCVLPHNDLCPGFRPTLQYPRIRCHLPAIPSPSGVPREGDGCDSERWQLSPSVLESEPVKTRASAHTSIHGEPGRVLAWVHSFPQQGPPLTAVHSGWRRKKTICWLPRTQAWWSR